MLIALSLVVTGILGYLIGHQRATKTSTEIFIKVLDQITKDIEAFNRPTSIKNELDLDA